MKLRLRHHLFRQEFTNNIEIEKKNFDMSWRFLLDH